MDQEGIEPSTSSMRMKRSTDELLAHKLILPLFRLNLKGFYDINRLGRGGGMADTQVSKTCERKFMRVRLSPAAPICYNVLKEPFWPIIFLMKMISEIFFHRNN